MFSLAKVLDMPFAAMVYVKSYIEGKTMKFNLADHLEICKQSGTYCSNREDGLECALISISMALLTYVTKTLDSGLQVKLLQVLLRTSNKANSQATRSPFGIQKESC